MRKMCLASAKRYATKGLLEPKTRWSHTQRLVERTGKFTGPSTGSILAGERMNFNLYSLKPTTSTLDLESCILGPTTKLLVLKEEWRKDLWGTVVTRPSNPKV